MAGELDGFACMLDVSDTASVRAGIGAATAALGDIDVLVNNAGTDRFAFFVNTDEELRDFALRSQPARRRWPSRTRFCPACRNGARAASSTSPARPGGSARRGRPIYSAQRSRRDVIPELSSVLTKNAKRSVPAFVDDARRAGSDRDAAAQRSAARARRGRATSERTGEAVQLARAETVAAPSSIRSPTATRAPSAAEAPCRRRADPRDAPRHERLSCPRASSREAYTRPPCRPAATTRSRSSAPQARSASASRCGSAAPACPIVIGSREFARGRETASSARASWCPRATFTAHENADAVRAAPRS